MTHIVHCDSCDRLIELDFQPVHPKVCERCYLRPRPIAGGGPHMLCSIEADPDAYSSFYAKWVEDVAL